MNDNIHMNNKIYKNKYIKYKIKYFKLLKSIETHGGAGLGQFTVNMTKGIAYAAIDELRKSITPTFFSHVKNAKFTTSSNTAPKAKADIPKAK